MSNRFFLSDSEASDSGEDTLPYPKPLSRAAFLTPDFDPPTYLSSLRNRHQTLDDLRTELRTRTQEISKELLDLVNENYQDFLSLGSSLQGGDEKVEEVRLGLLGFKRDVEGLKSTVDEQRADFAALVAQRKEIRSQLQVGRALLDIDQRLQNLEQSLMVVSNGTHGGNEMDENGEESSDSGEEGDDNHEGSSLILRLKRHVEQYLLAQNIIRRVGLDHPFIVNQQSRFTKIKDTILLDLGNALKQAVGQDNEQVAQILIMYRDLGGSQEALKLVKEGR
ncbi:MAG: hypothetical protein Q9220_004170 [cf. Caloplaca sp. 1 TL-2023]